MTFTIMREIRIKSGIKSGTKSRMKKARGHADSARFGEHLGRWLLLPLMALFGTANAEYADDWGPVQGAPVPVLEAYDQDGVLRSLDNLTGSQGLLLFLNRSADW